MRVAERLARREQIWRELDTLLTRFEEAGALRGRVSPWRRAEPIDPDADPTAPSPDGRIGAAEVVRLGELYRAACSDLMLAEAYLAIGEDEKALEWLELVAQKAARHEPDGYFFGLMSLRMNVLADPVLDRPEFVAALSRIRGD